MSRIAFMLVMAALLATIPALKVRAQGDNCFGLKSEDCQLIQASAANSPAKLSSFEINYTLNTKVSGTGTSDSELKVTGGGPIAIDQSKLSGGAGMSMTNLDAVLPALTMQNTLSVSATTNGKNQSDNVEIRIVDGKVYYKDDQQTKGKWMQTSASSLSGNSSLASGGGVASQAMSDPAVMAAFAKLPYIKGFITAQRGADLDIGGEKSAHFTFNVDLLTLLQSPELKDALKAVMTSMGQATEQLDTMMGQYTGMAQTFLKNLKITVHEYVGTTDQTLHGVGLDIALNLDAATAGMLMNSTSANPVDVNISFDAKLTKIGQPVTVEAVPDAEVATPASSQ